MSNMSLNTLPLEIIRLIVTFLPRWEHPDRAIITEQYPAKLPPIATISRRWQTAVESITFEWVYLKSTALSDFRRIMTRERQSVLRYLNYYVVLPAYPDEACGRFETQAEMDENNRSFTESIRNIFNLLRAWHEQALEGEFDTNVRSIRLSLADCYSPMDGSHRGRAKYKQDRNNFEFGLRHDLFDHRYESSLIRLLDLDSLPELPQVYCFNQQPCHRDIEPKSIVALASKMPKLEEIRWHLSDDEKKRAALRQQLRFDFAIALSKLQPKSLKKFSLHYCCSSPSDQRRDTIGALIAQSPEIDHLSVALQSFSQRCGVAEVKLTGDIVISAALFQPNASLHLWANLQRIEVNFNMNTIDGAWLFVQSDHVPEYSDEEVSSSDESSDESEIESSGANASANTHVRNRFNKKKEDRIIGHWPVCQFRGKADAEKCDKLFSAAAQATRRMPLLREMSLWTQVRAYRDFYFGMTYLAPRESHNFGPGSRDLDAYRIFWVTGPSGYVPDTRIVSDLKGAIACHDKFVWRTVEGLHD